MSFILRKSLARDASQLRAMNQQFDEIRGARIAAESCQHPTIGTMFANHRVKGLTTNAGQIPFDVYREFDATTKIEQVPAGEHATLTRLLQNARSVSIGREVFEYRQASDAGQAQSSMSGQIGVKMDHVDYKTAGTIVPIHDIGFGRRFREVEAMRSEDFDALLDDSRESERKLLTHINDYLFDGNSALALDGKSWTGLRNDSTVASYTLTVDLTAGATTGTAFRNEFKVARDVLRITNNCAMPLTVGVSREIYSNGERRYSDSYSSMTIIEECMRLNGIKEIYEDSELSGNQMIMYWNDQFGLVPIVGMGMNTVAMPRPYYNSNFDFVKWAAVGFLARNDYSARKCALYASS